jgi:hypothetical protein
MPASAVEFALNFNARSQGYLNRQTARKVHNTTGRRSRQNEYRFALRRLHDIKRPLDPTVAASPALLVDIGDCRSSRSFPNPKIW